MFLGGLPRECAPQIIDLLATLRSDRVFVCCSGSFRMERIILRANPAAEIVSNDVSLLSCAIGAWLSGGELAFRFKDELEPLEAALTGASPRQRAAGAVVAIDLTQWGKGKPNPYKLSHWNHLLSDLPALLDKTEAKLDAAFAGLRLAGFRARDWLEHMDEAIAEGATVATFPPFYKGGYEALYKWADQRTDWERPGYAVFDPKALHQVADKLSAARSDYLLITNQRLERQEARALFVAANGTQHWAYSDTPTARLMRKAASLKPFAYDPLDLKRLTKTSKVEIQRVDGPRAMYIRQIYLKKTITPTAGEHNYMILLGGMLAGVLVYAEETFRTRPDCIYLLSDVSVSREAKVSKLIARLAANRAVLRDMASRKLTPIGYVRTTAFSDHPVSMKYRGVFELLTRKETEQGFDLTYGSPAIDETLGDAFSWWWSTYHDDKPKAQNGRRR